MIFRHLLVILWVWLIIPSLSYSKETLHIAVASNFAPTLKRIAKHYQALTPNTPKLRFIIGSSGKHYAQIIHGAPYDLFFSADKKKPQALIQKGIISQQQVLTYATGRLVLWSNLLNTESIPIQQQFTQLPTQANHHSQPTVTIANPRLAPYGLAAQQTLLHLGLWNDIQRHLVLGENINQSFHFVSTKAITYGFIAYSQWLSLPPEKKIPQSHWLIPEHYHAPITQQVAVIKTSTASTTLIQFMLTDAMQQLIRQHGYNTNYNK